MRKTKLIYCICQIALSCILSTACSGQQAIVDTTDKICLTSTEFNYFIGAAYDSHTYKDLFDSIKTINHRNELKLQGKDYEIKEAKALIVVKDTLISYQKQESDNLKAELKYERKWKGFWKKTSSWLGAAFLLYFGYNEIKKD